MLEYLCFLTDNVIQVEFSGGCRVKMGLSFKILSVAKSQNMFGVYGAIIWVSKWSQNVTSIFTQGK